MNIRCLIDEYLKKYKYEIVSQVCDFVKIPSINKNDNSEKFYGENCALALDYCAQLCKEKKLNVINHEYRGLEVKCDNNTNGKRLVIASHADVVDVVDDNIYPPFYGKVVGDYIIGRGVVDDKAPLIASLYALAFFKENNIPLKNDIRLFFGSNEECGMDDIEYYLNKVGQPDWGLSIDDDFPTVNGEKGLIHFTIEAKKSKNVKYINSYGSKQRLVHDYCESLINDVKVTFGKTDTVLNPVAHRFLNTNVSIFEDNKIDKLIKDIILSEDGEELGIKCSDDVSGKIKVKVFSVKTENENIVLEFDIRVPVNFKNDDIIEKLYKYSEANNLLLKVTKVSNGYYHSPENEMISLLTNLYNNEMNLQDKPYVMSACTYARAFKNGCGFGAGSGHEVKPFEKGHGGAHGADEAHNIYVLLDAIKMFILAIKSIDDLWNK